MVEPRLPLTGGCLCGAVRYSINELPVSSGHCHCRNCRKQTGAAFATDGTFRSSAVSWSGREQTYYRSSQSCERGFCSTCGSTVSARYSTQPDIVIIAAGSLDDVNVLAPSVHAFVKDKATWMVICDDLAQYPEALPDFVAESRSSPP